MVSLVVTKSPTMANPVYVYGEREALCRVFVRYASEADRMRHMGYYNYPVRTYSAYCIVYAAMTRPDNEHYLHYIRARNDMDLSDSDSSGSDSDSDFDDEVTFLRISQATSTTTSTKRPRPRVDGMTLEELDEYERELQGELGALAKRRKEYEEKCNDTRLPSCAICKEDGCRHVMVSKCGHTFCNQCTISFLCMPLPTYQQRHHTCPVCRAELGGSKAIRCMKPSATNGEIFRETKLTF